MNPIWIIVKDIDDEIIFEGHQGHWGDCYFSNSYERMIRHELDNSFMFEECRYEIREMTDDELVKFPEAVKYQWWLLETYGEI
jgi:hypothetical protein